VLDRRLEPVRTFEKHEVSIPDTGATMLTAVALVGDRSWVSAGPKQQQIGLSAYRL
jgi:hypothetical protein